MVTVAMVKPVQEETWGKLAIQVPIECLEGNGCPLHSLWRGRSGGHDGAAGQVQHSLQEAGGGGRAVFPVEMMILRTKAWCNPIGPNKELSLPSGIAINHDFSWLIWTASLDRKSNIYLTMVISTTKIMHDPLPITFQTLKLYYISQVP